MTKILITGDIHLKIKEERDFNEKRFFNLANEIKAQNPDIIILNGDIFDKANPTWYEVNKFYEWVAILANITDKIYLVSGNHEELSATTSVFDYLPQLNFTYIQSNVVNINDDIALWLISHHKINDIYTTKRYFSRDVNILVSHYRSKVNKFMTSEVDNMYVAKTFDYTILSDIHMHFKPADNIEYTSSPYAVKYAPVQDYGFIMLEIDGADYEVKHIKLSLPNLVKWEVSNSDDFLKLKVHYENNKKDLYKVVLYNELGESEKEWLANSDRIVDFSFENNITDEKIEEVVEEIKSSFTSIKITDVLRDIIKPTENWQKELFYQLELLEKEL